MLGKDMRALGERVLGKDGHEVNEREVAKAKGM
jgi:hypothetical protein